MLSNDLNGSTISTLEPYYWVWKCIGSHPLDHVIKIQKCTWTMLHGVQKDFDYCSNFCWIYSLLTVRAGLNVFHKVVRGGSNGLSKKFLLPLPITPQN